MAIRHFQTVQTLISRELRMFKLLKKFFIYFESGISLLWSTKTYYSENYVHFTNWVSNLDIFGNTKTYYIVINYQVF